MTDRSKLNEAMERLRWAIQHAFYRRCLAPKGCFEDADEAQKKDAYALAVIEEALADYESVKAKRDRLSEAHCALYLQHEKLKAELARYRPIIEAVIDELSDFLFGIWAPGLDPGTKEKKNG